MRWPLLPVSAALAFSVANVAGAADHYVSPRGTSDGDGSEASPWDLATALAHPAAVQPGDTLWLLGGTYPGSFTSDLTGTARAPIVVRQKDGERATLDGGDTGGAPILAVGGAYTWFWGFEITSSDPKRTTSETGSSPGDIPRGDCIITRQSEGEAIGVKFVHLILHDCRQGYGFWKEAEDAEIYGNVIYYNGWDAPDRGHGHGIYTQNDTGQTIIVASEGAQ